MADAGTDAPKNWETETKKAKTSMWKHPEPPSLKPFSSYFPTIHLSIATHSADNTLSLLSLESLD